MRVGWIASVTGCFGAVREMIEVSNALIRLGHQVTIYSEAGEHISWLPFAGNVGTFTDAARAHDDVAILLSDWKRKHYDAFMATTPRLRCVTVMGFDPSPELRDGLRADGAMVHDPAVMREALRLPGVLVLADSSWQTEWLTANVGVVCGPPIGGVNLAQFHPVVARRAHEPYRILATGDPRERKGSDVVKAAFSRLNQKKIRAELITYWGKRLPQEDMAAWYSDGDVFIDAEKRAGWCNPVAEAMACGTACISTDIGAVRDFAIEGETALLVPVDDDKALANAIVYLLGNEPRRRGIAAAGLQRIRQFSYDIIGKRLAEALQERLSD
jgi:hypothetical protein